MLPESSESLIQLKALMHGSPVAKRHSNPNADGTLRISGTRIAWSSLTTTRVSGRELSSARAEYLSILKLTG